MKYIQFIDGSINCVYDIYSIGQAGFKAVFPGCGQDIEFFTDLVARLGRSRADELLDVLNRQRVDKKTAAGIHGTLFFELNERKACFPSKRELDVRKANMPAANFAKDKSLKYIQLIDSSDSCTHDVCEIDGATFKKIFIARRQDIEFLEDFKGRIGAKQADQIQKTLASRLVDKKTIPRIDGTLFIDLYYKKEFYPTKIDMEVEPGSRPL